MNGKPPPHIPKTALKFPTQSKPVAEQSPVGFRIFLIALIVVLVCILAGLLAWLFLLQQPLTTPTPSPVRPTAEQNNEPESSTAEAAVTTLEAMSPSTEIDAIATDLEGTTIVDLEPLFVDIEAMF